MIDLPYINLPDTFTLLLQRNMHPNKTTMGQIAQYLSLNQGLLSLIQKFYVDIDAQGRLPKIISRVGWDIFRNQLASIFLYRQENNCFPKGHIDLSIGPLLNFEDKLKEYTVSGYSRSFLLAFYFSMINKKSGNGNIFEKFEITDKLVSFLKIGKSKIIKIDWLVLSLIHYDYFFEDDELNDLLEAGVSYSDLFDQLTDGQKKTMMNNYLSYGSSIEDIDIFTARRL